MQKAQRKLGYWLGAATATASVGLAVVSGAGVAAADDGDGRPSTAGTRATTHTATRPAAHAGPRRSASSTAARRASAAPIGTPVAAHAAQAARVAPAAPPAGALTVRPTAVAAATPASRVTVRSVINDFLTWVSQQLQFGSRAGIAKHTDIAYGPDTAQKLDVYAPLAANDAPVIVMIHGGGWAVGDKSHLGVVRNKVNHFVSDGYVFVSINYPMLPSSPPDQQADSIAAAITYVQAHASEWGGDADNVVVMGHSAGAHLAALVSAQSDRYPELRAWRGTVVLDSGALDLVALMQSNPLPLYKRAFGDDPAYWTALSPLAALHQATEPVLLVCSTQRRHSCDEADDFAAAARALGTDVAVLPENLSHGQINRTLGKPGAYTDTVDAFILKVTGGPAT